MAVRADALTRQLFVQSLTLIAVNCIKLSEDLLVAQRVFLFHVFVFWLSKKGFFERLTIVMVKQTVLRIFQCLFQSS